MEKRLKDLYLLDICIKPKSLIQFILVLLFFSNLTFSQEAKLRGKISDSLGVPLELSNVIATYTTTNKMATYGVTNAKGEYTLNLQMGERYQIKISYVGMQTQVDTLTMSSKILVRDYALNPDNALDAVEIKYEMPVFFSGDTLVYRADAFKDGTERKLKDVIKKIPGMEINDRGEIEYEGEKVKKLMVEGKDFFEGDTKLAVDNIPANAVDQLQVLKDYNEVNMMKNVVGSDNQLALNVKLKEGFKKFWFGDIETRGGLANDMGLYAVQPNLFYYSPKVAVNLINDFNNIGELAFTRQDYTKFDGFGSSQRTQSGTNFDLIDNNPNFLSVDQQRAQEIRNSFNAGNFVYTPNKKLTINGFVIFLNNNIDLFNENQRIFQDDLLDIPDEFRTERTNQNNNLGLAKFKSTYIPNENNYFNYNAIFNIGNEEQRQRLNSNIINNARTIDENDVFSINQTFRAYRNINTKNIVALNANHLIKREKPFYEAIIDKTENTDDDLYLNVAQLLGLNLDQENYNLNQFRDIKTHHIDASLDYWNILNKKSNINITLGAILNRQIFSSQLFQTLDNGSIFNPDQGQDNLQFENDITYNFRDLSVGLHYNLKAGIFTFSPGLSLRALYGENNQQSSTSIFEDTQVLPDMNLTIRLQQSERIIFNYKIINQYEDIQQYALGTRMNNFNNFFSGNNNLILPKYTNYSLSYRSFNTFNYTNVFLTIDYKEYSDVVRTSRNFIPGSQTNLSNPFNLENLNRTWFAYGRFQKEFKVVKTTLDARYYYSEFDGINNDVPFQGTINNQTYTLKFSSLFKKSPNFILGYTLDLQNNVFAGNENNFATHSPFFEMQYALKDQLTFKTDFKYNVFRNKESVINKFAFWNAELLYRKNQDARLEYSVKATNILSTDEQVLSFGGNTVVSTVTYRILPRFITFGLTYTI